jgi:hypothetical protein
LGFPLYTPGGGAAGLTVRIQFLCPASFLQQQGLSAGFVESVGLSIGGAGLYTEFVIRAGSSSVASLGPDWALNLPDQRVQVDRSGTVITGGGTVAAPINQWVDFSLDHPFYYTPGDSIVVDMITALPSPGPTGPATYCTTTVGNGQVERAYNFSYFPGSPATSFNMSGLKLRFNFAPLEMIEFGGGCSGSNNIVADLGSVGTPQIGQTIAITASQTITNTVGVFVFGFSRTEYAGNSLPQALGGGCELLVAADILEAYATPSSGIVGTSITIPNDPTLQGVTLYTQFAQFDPSSPANIPFVVSNGGVLSIY